MKKYYVLFYFFLSLSFFGQTKDTLAKYSISELQKKLQLDSEISAKSNIIILKEILKRDISDSLRAETTYNLGFNYFHEDISKSIFYTQEAKNLYKKLNDTDNLQKALLDIANLYAILNDYKSAIYYFELAKKSNNISSKNYTKLSTKEFFKYCSREESSTNPYFLIGNIEKSIHLRRMLLNKIENYLKANNKLDIESIKRLNSNKSFLYNSLVIQYCYQKRLDSAYYFIQQNKKLVDRFDDWYIEPFYLIVKGDYDNAIAKINGPCQKLSIKQNQKNFFHIIT